MSVIFQLNNFEIKLNNMEKKVISLFLIHFFLISRFVALGIINTYPENADQTQNTQEEKDE